MVNGAGDRLLRPDAATMNATGKPSIAGTGCGARRWRLDSVRVAIRAALGRKPTVADFDAQRESLTL